MFGQLAGLEMWTRDENDCSLVLHAGMAISDEIHKIVGKS